MRYPEELPKPGCDIVCIEKRINRVNYHVANERGKHFGNFGRCCLVCGLTPERVSSTGNAKLIATAVKAAARVLTTYSTTMVFMDLGSFVWHKALITKKNTKNGATAFRALTNKVPSISITARSLGQRRQAKRR